MRFKVVALVLAVALAAVPAVKGKGKEVEEFDWQQYRLAYLKARDIESQVYGEDPNTDFKPGYYKDFNVIDPDIPLSEDLQIDIQEICREADVCYELVLAIIEHESRFIPDVVSKSGRCKGLMQIDTNFHECADPFDPIENVRAGVKYLADLFEEHKDIGLVLDLYGGHSDAFWNHAHGTCSEMSQGIMIRAEELERKHGK